MSQNTSIREGGQGRAFGPVRALLVQGDGGKYYLWVPESDRQLGTKSIDKNGIYQAASDGVYGWSSVTVNVPTDSSVVGRDPDTGEEVIVKPDPETGDITKTVLPVEIRVVTPPDKTTYENGETIDKLGMVVKAYTATGAEWGVVSNGAIMLHPSKANFSSGPTQTITVSWPRTGDGAVLETSFDIQVGLGA